MSADPYLPPRAFRPVPAPAHAGRRGMLWFAVPLLAILVYAQAERFLVEPQGLPGRWRWEPTLLLTPILLAGAAIGFTVGKRWLQLGWPRFLLMSTFAGELWCLATVLVFAIHADLVDLVPDAWDWHWLLGNIGTLATVMLPATLLLATGLRFHASKRP
jgi:hypothetical protein